MSTEKATEKPEPTVKVLRIGIVQNGKLIEERRLSKRETVTIGSSEKSTFSVVSAELPGNMEVFKYSNGKFDLTFNDTMDAVVQLSNEPLTLQALRAKATKRGDTYSVELNDESRGKIMFGPDGPERITVLFRFVDAPVDLTATGPMPAELRGIDFATLDIQFVSILVVVMITCISVVAYASRQPYVEPTSIDQISERFQRLIMPDRIPEPERPPDAAPSEETPKEKVAEKPKEPEEKKPAKPEPKGPVDEEAAASARKDAIAKSVASKGLLGVIGVKGKGGGALADVFSEGTGVEGELGHAFSGIQGVDIAEGSGQSATRGGGSGAKAEIGEIGTTGGGNVKTGAKAEAAISGRIDAEAPDIEGGSLDSATVQRTMRKYLSGVKDCYERALKRNPKLAGKITIAFEITESGSIAEFAFPVDNVGSPEVRQCIEARSHAWRFPRPKDGSVYVQFPLVFEPSSS